MAILYAALAKIVLTFYSANSLVTIFWPAAGLSLAAMLLGGRKYWISIYAGAFAGALWAGEATPTAAAVAVGSTLEPLLGSWLLTRRRNFGLALRSTRDFYRLVGLAGLLSPAICALLGVAVLVQTGSISGGSFWRNIALWWMGDTLGIVLVTPLILVWRPLPRIEQARLIEGGIVLGVSFLVGQGIFLDWFHDFFGLFNRGYWMYLVVTWAAIRVGARCVTLVLLVATIQALIGTAQGTGFFANDLARTNLGNFWAYTMILATVGMSLATLFAEREVAHRALEESEQRLQLFIEHAPVALAMFDRDMRYLAVSRRWLTDYGLEGASILGHSHYEVFPEIPAQWKEVHRRGLAGELVRAEDDRFERGDGSTQWLRWEVRPWREAGGAVGGIIILTEDISARKGIESALAEREMQYRAVIETASDGFWMLDEQGRLLVVNAAYAERSGYSHEELVAMSVSALEAQESGDDVRTHIAKVKQAGRDRFQTWHRTKAGEVWPVEVTAAYWAEAGGRFFAFLSDIGERKRAELALLESEARFRATFEQAAVGIAHVAPDGHWLRMNRKLCDIVGYSEEELRSLTFQDITHPDDLRPDLAQAESMLRGDIRTYMIEKRYIRKDSQTIWVNLTVSLARHPDNAPDYFISVIEDITERKRAEAALEALMAEREQLTKVQVASQTVAAIAHELNQPLNAVAAYAEAALRLLRAGNPQPGKLQHALESGAAQAQRAGRVVRELLTFMDQGEVQTEPLKLNEVVQQVMARVKADGFNSIQFRLDLDPALPDVHANRLQIEKVLVNLIENSIEAMRDAGIASRSIAVAVRTGADLSMAQVTVTDSGPGIEALALHRIFEPFFTTKPKGLGMGLAISRAIIEAHGGQLWVESTPDAGATFHFTLPFSP